MFWGWGTGKAGPRGLAFFNKLPGDFDIHTGLETTGLGNVQFGFASEKYFKGSSLQFIYPTTHLLIHFPPAFTEHMLSAVEDIRLVNHIFKECIICMNWACT